MFFVSGAYTIRPDVRPGTMTFHPAGFVHGPAPGGAEASLVKRVHEEYAVMIDTFGPLSLGPAGAECAENDYYLGWSRPRPAPDSGL
jgi:homogentisate 1,2-dioxygenase